MENQETFKSVPYVCKILKTRENKCLCLNENIPSEFLVEIKVYNSKNKSFKINIISSISPFNTRCQDNPNKKVLYELEAEYDIYINISEIDEKCIRNMLTEITYQHLSRNIEYIHWNYTVSYENLNLPSIYTLYSLINKEDSKNSLSRFLARIPICPFLSYQ